MAQIVSVILHFVLAASVIGKAPIVGIFFIISEIATWVLPMVERWGRMWYYVEIRGTILLILYVMPTVPKSNYRRKSL